MNDERLMALKSYGWMTWPELGVLASSTDWAVQFLHGLHVGPLPSQDPGATVLAGATHGWGWSYDSGVLWRARFDNGRALVASLSLVDGDGAAEPGTRVLQTQSRPALLWEIDEGRLSQSGRALMERLAEVGPYQWTMTIDMSPMSFLNRSVTTP